MSSPANSPAPAPAARSSLLEFWPRFLLFPLLAVVLYPPFVLGWGGDSLLVRTTWVAFLAFCWFCVGGAFHESVHETLFRNVSWNVWFGRVLGTLTLIPYTAYRETHRWHHAYLNTPDDYELWPYCDPKRSLAFRRLFVWIDLVGAVVTAPYIYARIYFIREPRLKPETRRTIFREFVGIALFWTLFAAGLVAFAHSRNFDWRQFDPVWLLPLLLSPLLNTLRKFVEHLGMTSRDPFLGTRTIVAGNLLSRLACYFNFDIAVHGPHHRYPRAHHYELESKLKSHLANKPQAQPPTYGSYLAAAIDVLPCLWRNPATGDHGTAAPFDEDGPKDFEVVETAPQAG